MQVRQQSHRDPFDLHLPRYDTAHSLNRALRRQALSQEYIVATPPIGRLARACRCRRDIALATMLVVCRLVSWPITNLPAAPRVRNTIAAWGVCPIYLSIPGKHVSLHHADVLLGKSWKLLPCSMLASPSFSVPSPYHGILSHAPLAAFVCGAALHPLRIKPSKGPLPATTGPSPCHRQPERVGPMPGDSPLYSKF